jgi:molecular chaperone GrpE
MTNEETTANGSAKGPEPDRAPRQDKAVEPNSVQAEQNQLLDRLRADLDEAKDRVLRSQAELDNYRKRAAREIEDNRRYANLPLIHDLLPALDNIERAIAAAEKAQDVAGLLEGVKLVARQFEDVLQRYHCTRIPALHQVFDPHLHQSISQQPTDEYPPNTVVLVSQAGFRLHDRVVRPSQVIVSAPKDKEISD